MTDTFVPPTGVASETETLAERLRASLRAPGGALSVLLASAHPADLAAALRDLAPPEALAVFTELEPDRAAEALDELDPELTRYLVDHAPPERLADLLDRLPMDDAAEVVAEAPEARARLLRDLSARAPRDAEEVRKLLAYPAGTAGRLMTDRYAAVPPQVTAAQALAYLRANALALETVTVLYVVERQGRLVGVVPLRRLLVAGEWQSVREIMLPDPITVMPQTDQQEVARLVSRYDLAAIPVVDDAGRLLGIVTVDDVIDVLVEEFTEDYLRLVGSDAEEMDRRSPAQIAKLRVPWLLGTMGIELFAGLVISHFDAVLQQVILLASFMPVISAVSGNIGLQAAAIVVRGLDTGHVTLKHGWRQVSKELTTALLLAAACGLVLGLAFWVTGYQTRGFLTFGVLAATAAAGGRAL